MNHNKTHIFISKHAMLIALVLSVSYVDACSGKEANQKAQETKQTVIKNISITKETTFFRAPLKSNATVDYVRALNKRL